MKRKLLLAGILSVLVFGIVGCGKSDEVESTSGSTSETQSQSQVQTQNEAESEATEDTETTVSYPEYAEIALEIANKVEGGDLQAIVDEYNIHSEFFWEKQNEEEYGNYFVTNLRIMKDCDITIKEDSIECPTADECAEFLRYGIERHEGEVAKYEAHGKVYTFADRVFPTEVCLVKIKYTATDRNDGYQWHNEMYFTFEKYEGSDEWVIVYTSNDYSL